jgi:adenylylsulfate kinase-like enzyme
MTAPEPGPETGTVYWVTGLAGAGKTTLGAGLHRALRARGRNAVFLDGDALREVLGDPTHDLGTRRATALRYGRLCRLLAAQGLDVVCATISLFHEVRAWNRANIGRYVEVFLDASMETLIARDPKQLYARARRGELRDVVGVDIPAELPDAPDVRVVSDGVRSAEDVLDETLRALGLASEVDA